MGQTNRAEQLKEIAQEKWGKHWTLKTFKFADGSTEHVVLHSRGLVDDGILERDRLLYDGEGNIVHDRERATKEIRQSHEVIERRIDF